MTFTVETKSQLAKLLATENLNIVHDKISTARFDPVNRILYCPIWNDMSGDLYDLLLGHEVGHGIDLAVGKMETGDAGRYASETEGTFQKMITDKVGPDIIASMRATGVSEERIKEYSGKNRELFANLYTDVKPAMQAILAHTGDAELGMIAMVDELRKTGDTFSGLSASDLRPEIEGIRDAARATREALEKQQGELEGQKSIAEEEIASRGSNITELKAKQAEQKLALDNVDVKTPTKEITTSFNVTGKGNKKLNQGQIEEEIRTNLTK